MDPKLDPNSDQYDPRLDQNSAEYDQAAYDDYQAQQESNQSQTTAPPSSESGAPTGSPSEQKPEGKALTKETLWQQYAVDAINQLYPGIRNGIDYVWSRAPDDPEGEPRILNQSKMLAPLDEGKIREAAQKMADADPYSFYDPQRPLHAGSILGQGEVRPRVEGERYPADNTPGQVQGAPGSPSTPPVEPLPGGTPQ
jgi:hypothetical protein